MAKYYATALTKEGKSVLIEALETEHINALNECLDHCYKTGLYFQELRVVRGSQKQPSTMTKFYSVRRKTGSNGRGYDRAL